MPRIRVVELVLSELCACLRTEETWDMGSNNGAVADESDDEFSAFLFHASCLEGSYGFNIWTEYMLNGV